MSRRKSNFDEDHAAIGLVRRETDRFPSTIELKLISWADGSGDEIGENQKRRRLTVFLALLLLETFLVSQLGCKQTKMFSRSACMLGCS